MRRCFLWMLGCWRTGALLTALAGTTWSLGDGGQSILVVRGAAETFDEVTLGMREELDGGVGMCQLTIDRTTACGRLVQAMGETLPKMVVLMDNAALALFAEYQGRLGQPQWSVPALALMCIDVERAVAGMPNTSGIVYEVPLVTSVVALRSLVHTSIKRVGVVHREMMAPLVERNRGYCTGEDVQIVARAVEDRSMSYRWEVLRAVRSVLRSGDIDALWVLNDNVLLRPDIVSDIWTPLTRRYRMPVIVGAKRLAEPSVGLGTIAVIPDHRALGAQGAQIVLATRKNKWQPPSQATLQPPLSVVKVVNLPNLRACAEVCEDGLDAVDVVLK